MNHIMRCLIEDRPCGHVPTPAERAELASHVAEAIAMLATPVPIAPARTTEAQPGLLDAKAAAVYLGVKESWVLKQSRDGKLPFVRLGRYKRFRRQDLDVAPKPEDQ